MSWVTPAEATNKRREITERFRPILAEVCDLLRAPRLLADALAPNTFALVASPTGVAFQLPNRTPGPHLGEGGALRRLLLEKLGFGTPRRFICPTKPAAVIALRSYPAEATWCWSPGMAPWPRDLTA